MLKTPSFECWCVLRVRSERLRPFRHVRLFICTKRGRSVMNAERLGFQDLNSYNKALIILICLFHCFRSPSSLSRPFLPNACQVIKGGKIVTTLFDVICEEHKLKPWQIGLGTLAAAYSTKTVYVTNLPHPLHFVFCQLENSDGVHRPH